ncbi:CxxH/CxxC protein (TIGR04129 family) [Bacillus pakistanensis]|uniref:CxxH/CxxC protein (TIGR04129 family) n=1 Tax=Rossellomorea pakistanensis TaxID=992288 RepID=A0ABS2NB82_9BACI|nr:CxxH/CxxC protein [Bacillus pakistanensis]MBM7585110.1 CxxH/CxxC protein (TIGR04129 family) [Bacillus pakistanensis]
MIYCCKEHVELAMDIVVDEYEVAPVLEQLTEEQSLSTTCEYCENNATYIVAN